MRILPLFHLNKKTVHIHKSNYPILSISHFSVKWYFMDSQKGYLIQSTKENCISSLPLLSSISMGAWWKLSRRKWAFSYIAGSRITDWYNFRKATSIESLEIPIPTKELNTLQKKIYKCQKAHEDWLNIISHMVMQIKITVHMNRGIKPTVNLDDRQISSISSGKREADNTNIGVIFNYIL